MRVDGAWDAEVRIRRTFTEANPTSSGVTCWKPSAKVAEERAAIYASRGRSSALEWRGREQAPPCEHRGRTHESAPEDPSSGDDGVLYAPRRQPRAHTIP